MLGLGLMEMNSSELQIRGGAASLDSIFTKIKNVVNFIADYVPKIVKGFIDGFAISIF